MRCRSVRPTQRFLAQKFVCDNLEFRENELPHLHRCRLLTCGPGSVQGVLEELGAIRP
jgi:hypothetical protein